MAINFLNVTNTLPEIQINDTDNNPRLAFKESGVVSGGVSTTGGDLVLEASSGIERARILSTGNFGIGTATPTAAKLVVASAGTDPQIMIKNTAGNNAIILLEDNSGGSQNASITFDQGSQNTLTIATGYQSPSDLNRIYLAPAGNTVLTAIGGSGGISTAKVGIGTTTPENRLHLLTQTTDETQQLLIQNGSSGDAAIKFNISGDTYSLGIDNSDSDKFKVSFGNLGSNDRLVIDSTGNVGIGTNSPQAKLHVSDTTRIDGILFTRDVNAGYYGNAADLTLRSGAGGRTLINPSGGNVGIGTTNPVAKLDVKTATAPFTALKVSNYGTNVNALYAGAIDDTYLYFGSGFYYNSSKFRAPSTTAAITSYDSGVFRVFTNSGLTANTDYTPTERMRISSAGAIKFNAYGAGTLVTDASGNITASSGGGAGGPFLPLAGGTMTGTSGVIMPNDFNLKAGNSGRDAPAYTFRDDTNTGMFQDIDDALSFSAGGATVLHMDGADAFIPRYITHYGDPNTYFGFSGDDTIKFNTNGSEAISIDSSGNTTFSGNVTIAKSTPVLIFNNLAGGGLDPSLTATGTNFTISTSSITPLAIALDTGNATFRGDVISTDGTDTATLSKTGLTLSRSNSYIQSNADNSDTINIGQSSVRWGHVKVDGSTFKVLNGGNERFGINSSGNATFTGNVGINNTSPGEKLEVTGNIFVSGKFGNLVANTSGVQFEAATGATQTCRFDSDEMRFFAGGGVGEVFTMLNSSGATTFINTVTATNFILSSDERLKENIKTLEPKVISAEWKSFNAKNDNSYRTGVIAQELEKKHPEFVETNDKGFKSVKYIDLLISKIAELEARLEKAGI